MNFIEVLFLLGGIALIATVLVYPRDVFKTIFVGFPKAILEGVWSNIWIVLIPVWGPFWLLDQYFKWGMFERFEMAFSSDYKYSGAKRKINFNSFNKYILTTETNQATVSQRIEEASSTIGELDISEYDLTANDGYLIIELPNVGFYGFSFLIQWLNNEFKDCEVYGFATGSRTELFLYQDPKTTNNLIGRTNRDNNFSVSMYDDLDSNTALRMNQNIEVKAKLTTSFFAELIKRSYPNGV